MDIQLAIDGATVFKTDVQKNNGPTDNLRRINTRLHKQIRDRSDIIDDLKNTIEGLEAELSARKEDSDEPEANVVCVYLELP